MLMPLIQLIIFISGELNISSSQTQKQLPDNKTIQSFLEAYVDNYMGGSTVKYQGWVVRKPVNAKPGLKVNRSIDFSWLKCFLLLMVWVV